MQTACRKCGKTITEYRGLWWSAGDTTRCYDNKPDYHAPAPRPTAESTRASIVQYLKAEARRFEAAYNAPHDDEDATSHDMRTQRLTAKVSILRTMAAYVERGDDVMVLADNDISGRVQHASERDE